MHPFHTLEDPFILGDLTLHSRVLLGTSRYPNQQSMLDCLDASGTEMVTISLRRVPTHTQGAENLYQQLRERNFHLLPNTAGCFTAKEAILTAELAREALETNWIKLEVIADEETLLPEGEELLEAAEVLVRSGFQVLPYTNDDPVLAQKLEQVGCTAVMPLASPIGTGLGIRNPHNLQLIRSRVSVPVIVDAGLGTASDITQAFELGCDAVLLNTAVARAQNPVQMAKAVGSAAYAGRMAYLSGRMPAKNYAVASTPMKGESVVSVPKLLIIAERGYCPSTRAWIETIQCILDSLKRYPSATLQIRNKSDDEAWTEIAPMLKHWFSAHPTQLQLNGLYQPHRYCMRHLPETSIDHSFDKRPTILGTSIHSIEALHKAESKSVDYVQYGAIFPTSKPVRPLGLKALHRICQQTSLPVLAVGGISTPHHIEACLNNGAYGVSIGSWILHSTDIPATLECIVTILN